MIWWDNMQLTIIQEACEMVPKIFFCVYHCPPTTLFLPCPYLFPPFRSPPVPPTSVPAIRSMFGNITGVTPPNPPALLPQVAYGSFRASSYVSLLDWASTKYAIFKSNPVSMEQLNSVSKRKGEGGGGISIEQLDSVSTIG